MIIFPNAKINFGLYVTAQRRDGYHNIESVLYPVPWTDVLEIVPAQDQKFHFQYTGRVLDVADDSNLVVQAWEMMRERFDLPDVHIHLHKIIPPRAGLGGGSSDAAHTILLLDKIFNLHLSTKRKQSLASKLGSDCPFFIDGKPHFVAGTGDLLAQSRVNLNGYHIGIVKPDINISTAAAYNAMKPAPVPEKWELVGDNPEQWQQKVRNQFEDYVMENYTEIFSLKKRFYELDAVYASLTGSGLAIYGLFHEAPEMEKWFPELITWHGQLE